MVRAMPPLPELTLDLDELQAALEIDAIELQARFSRNPEQITEREEEALRIYAEALEIKNASMFNKNQQENTGQ